MTERVVIVVKIAQVLDVARTAERVYRTDGYRGLAGRILRSFYDRLGTDMLDFPLLLDDVADSGNLNLQSVQIKPSSGSPLTVGWLTTPPGLGSGGHTTMFRMITALEEAGHRCIIFLYDRYQGVMRQQEAVIRQGWPGVKAEVRDSRDGVCGVDACFATSWPTAHVLAVHGGAPMERFYFIQDYEPFFYPHGPEYALADDTYRMGYTAISLGRMMANLLASRGLESKVIEFGCDTSTYRLSDQKVARSGVVFFARPGVPRRGFTLGCLALRDFHERHPDQEIHVYGCTSRDLGFPATHHERLTPDALNNLYNSTIAGLALSFTNISLVASEMLASGTVPVINDSPYSRAGLDSEQAVWSPPTPRAIANALSDLVTKDDVDQRARRAAQSVRGLSWQASRTALVRIVEESVYAQPLDLQ